MRTDRLICDGIMVGKILLPPFRLSLGDLICLHMPCLAGSREETEVVEALTGSRALTGIQVHGRAIAASPPCFRRGLLAHLNHPTGAKWLRRTAGMTAEEATATVQRLGL